MKELSQILIIEYEPMFKKILKKSLIQYGFNVFDAKDNQEGLSIYIKNRDKIDCVICDLNIHKESYIKLIKKIKKDKENIDIIISSAIIDTNTKTDLIKYGINKFLEKPYLFEDLINIIKRK